MLLRRFLLALFATGASASATAPWPWQEIAPLPAGTAGFARGAIATGPLVAGGNRWDGDSKLTLDEVWAYDATSDTWRLHTRLPRPFAFGTHGVYDGTLYLLGGDDGGQTRADLVAVGIGSPSVATHHPPQPIAYAGGAVLDSILYVLGGSPDASAPLRMHDSFLALNLSNGEVRELPAHPGGPVIHAALATAGGRILAFTGGRPEGTPPALVNSAAAWGYDPGSRTWTSLPPYPFAARGVSICALDDRHLLLAGGYRDPQSGQATPAFTGECFVFDTVTAHYRPLPPLPYAAMLVGLVVHDGWVYAFGGEDSPRHRSTRAYRAPVSAFLPPINQRGTQIRSFVLKISQQCESLRPVPQGFTRRHGPRRSSRGRGRSLPAP